MLTKPEIYADRIYYYKNVIDSPDKLITQIEESDSRLKDTDPIGTWSDWLASGGGEPYVFGSIKHTDESKLVTGSAESISIHKTLKTALAAAGKDYAQQLKIEYIDPMPVSISKYRTGADMGPHVDDYGQDGVLPLMSAVIYLNDDYEGGELSFPEQDVMIKPEAGSIIVFPSVEPFYHQSMPLKTGTKYMVPAFWIKYQ
jgi:predicted 2-oxoglutarate/Fe(II)-dependent dioxygenase YbiX